MPRNDSALRILEIARLLEQATSGLTVKELQAALSERGHEAAIRTVYRDLEAISRLYPVFESDKTEEGAQRFCLEPMAKVTKYLALHPRELFALYFARGLLKPLEHTPFHSDLLATFRKIEDLIGTRGRDYLDELGATLSFEPGPKWGLGIDPALLETMRAACEERHVLSGVYVSTKDQTPRARRLGPHFLYYAKGGIYLVAEDLDSEQVKTYSLPRFQSAEMLAEAYEKAPVEPSAFFAASFGVYVASQVEEVELEFESSVARFVAERQWHASQRVVLLEHGRARVSFSVALTPEFISWVLGFGPEARVTKCEKLIEGLVEQSSRVREMYWKRAG
jgi:predicted DNA-binding transcriptional regulator YafY